MTRRSLSKIKTNSAMEPTVKPFAGFGIKPVRNTYLRGLTEKLIPSITLIYDIGVKHECSHFKHGPRLLEAILMTDPGKKVRFNFDAEKTKRCCESYKNAQIEGEEIATALKAWKTMQALLEDYNKECDMLPSEEELLVFQLVTEIVNYFQGGINPENFHREKIRCVNEYNNVCVDAGIETEFTPEELIEMYTKPIPIVVSDELTEDVENGGVVHIINRN